MPDFEEVDRPEWTRAARVSKYAAYHDAVRRTSATGKGVKIPLNGTSAAVWRVRLRQGLKGWRLFTVVEGSSLVAWVEVRKGRR